jgi:hypothetical protein
MLWREGKAIELNDPVNFKVATLREELEVIYRANYLFWQRGAEATVEERHDYYVRTERLEEIRAEFARLPLRQTA